MSKKETYLKCPECGKVCKESDWQEESQDCEVCGWQDGIGCPNCGSVFTDCDSKWPEKVKHD